MPAEQKRMLLMPGKRILPIEGSRPLQVTPSRVKLCELCATLNFEDNKECWTCRWRGGFSRDPQMIALAWQRLETQYEEVRLEHVTARRASVVDDFGKTRPAEFPQQVLLTLGALWQRFVDRRDLRQAQRQARLQSRMPSPPDQLSI